MYEVEILNSDSSYTLDFLQECISKIVRLDKLFPINYRFFESRGLEISNLTLCYDSY